jgi:ubiquitin
MNQESDMDCRLYNGGWKVKDSRKRARNSGGEGCHEETCTKPFPQNLCICLQDVATQKTTNSTM